MTRTYILTDSSVQFTKHSMNGRNLIEVVPFHIHISGVKSENDSGNRILHYPTSATQQDLPVVEPPSVAEYIQAIRSLSSHSADIIALSISSQLSGAYQNLQEAVKLTQGRTKVHLVDTQMIGLGLGYLVQQAAELADQGISADDIEYLVRGQIPHIYAQFCLPSLTYLTRSALIDYPQAVVGEMLGILPVFSFEEGKLVSIEKVKNYRALLDYFQEFLDEFSELDAIAVMQSVPSLLQDARVLKEHAGSVFPKVPFSEHSINPVIAAMLGPRSVGIFAIEKPEEI